MRAATTNLLLLFTILVTASCAYQRAPAVRYSPISAAPVRSSIDSAQAHAVKAKEKVADARKSASSETSRQLALEGANQEIDALTAELVTAQTALKDFEAKAAQQTVKLNKAIEDKKAAIEDKKAAEAQAKIDRRHAHRLKLYICGAGALIAALFAFQFRAVLLLLGPYGVVGGLVVLPATAFAALWKIL